MSRQQVVSYAVACDVCGEAIPDGESDDASRRISWQGAEYMVDVCSTHDAQLGQTIEKLGAFVTVGQRDGTPRLGPASGPKPSRPRPAAGGSSTPDGAGRRKDLAAIRSWAQQNGHKVGDRGRLPRDVVAAYDEAGGATAAPATRSRRRGRKVTADS